MNDHRNLLHSKMSTCSHKAKALFALLCAERLRSCCWAFHCKQPFEYALFTQWNDLVFRALSEAGEPVSQQFYDGIAEIESIVPEGGEPLAVQAQSGVVCLLSSLELLCGESSERVVAASNAVVDALDNYVFFTRRRISNDRSSPNQYALLSREIDRQLHDLLIAETFEDRTEVELSEIRIENFQYAIPIAV